LREKEKETETMNSKFEGTLTVVSKYSHIGSASVYNVAYGNKDFDYTEYTLKDVDGKEWSWRSYKMVSLEVGRSYSIIATIKSDGILTRCKIKK
jgi:hypothetical protein